MNLLTNLNFNQNQAIGLKHQVLSAAPTVPIPTAGLVYYDTTIGSYGEYNGTAWKYLAPSQNPLNTFAVPVAAVAMNTQKITGLAAGVASTDAANVGNITSTSLSAFSVPTAAVAMNSQKITGVAPGVALTDVANMANIQAAIDAISLGNAWKGQIRSVFTTNVASLTAGPTSNDGVTFISNDRLLLAGQTTQSQNGVYIWTTGGVFTRAGDLASNFEMSEGSTWEITEGTVGNPGGNAPQRWYVTTTGTINVNTTAIAIAWIGSGGATLTAGANVTIASNVVSVPNGTFVKKYAQLIGNGSLTTIVVTHNLAITPISGIFPCNMYLLDTSGNVQWSEAQSTSANTSTFAFTVAPSSGQFLACMEG